MTEETFCDGTPCELYIDGYCTDLSPKELGCVGKEHCRRFDREYLNSASERVKELEEALNYLIEQYDIPLSDYLKGVLRV